MLFLDFKGVDRLSDRQVYIKVTKDKYELPIAVADSPMELAKICGTTSNAIRSGIYHEKKNGKRSCFKKVILEE